MSTTIGTFCFPDNIGMPLGYIQAIKTVKNCVALGLKESKDIVDRGVFYLSDFPERATTEAREEMVAALVKQGVFTLVADIKLGGMRDLLHGIDSKPQRQDSLQNQLEDLKTLAIHFGMYDAVDHLERIGVLSFD